MKTIYKYKISITDFQDYSMSADAEILSVHKQRGEIQMWAIADPSKDQVKRTFKLFTTGEPFRELDNWNWKLDFIGTFMIQDDDLVFHLFEVKEV